MPEVISRYPDLVVKALERAGGICGGDQPQTILISCPPDRFCTVPGVEVCVLGTNQIHLAQQVTPSVLLSQPVLFLPMAAAGIVLLAVGWYLGRRQRPKPP